VVSCNARAVTDSLRGRTGRLLVIAPTDGATNMAIDEALSLGRRADTRRPAPLLRMGSAHCCFSAGDLAVYTRRLGEIGA
jgi:hypothetical protein